MTTIAASKTAPAIAHGGDEASFQSATAPRSLTNSTLWGLAASVISGVALLSGCEQNPAARAAVLQKATPREIITNPQSFIGKEIAVPCRAEFVEDRSALTTPSGSTTSTSVVLNLQLRYRLIGTDSEFVLPGMQSKDLYLPNGTSYSIKDIPHLTRPHEIPTTVVMVTGRVELCPFNGKPAFVISSAVEGGSEAIAPEAATPPK
jgi:hypothetical protein